MIRSQFRQHSFVFTCLIIAAKTVTHVRARNPTGASFHKQRSRFMHGCSAVCRGGWQRSVANANDSLMGILQTARKRLCNFILILIQLPIEVAFCDILHLSRVKKMTTLLPQVQCAGQLHGLGQSRQPPGRGLMSRAVRSQLCLPLRNQ